MSRVLVPFAVLGGAAALLLYTGREALTPAMEVRVIPVMAREGEGAASDAADAPMAAPSGGPIVQAPGWIEAAPFATTVAALAPGTVAEVLALEGDRVEAGQVVARLVSDDARLALRRAAAEVEERAAAVAIANADFLAAQQTWDNPTERRRAAAVAEAAVEEAAAAIAGAEAQIEVERAKAEELRDELGRRSTLVSSGAVSEGQIAQLELRVRAQDAVLEAAVVLRRLAEAVAKRARAELAAAQEALELRIEERRSLDGARASADGAAGALRRAEAGRDEAALLLERMEVRSPCAGVVLARLVGPGDHVAPMGDAHKSQVLRVYDPARLQARVDVPLADAAKIGVGQPAEVTTEALPGRTFRGRVVRLVHEANIQKNTVEVKVEIESPSEQLRPEMLARVRFMTMGAGEGAARAGDPGSGGVVGGAFERLFAPAEAILDVRGSEGRVWVVDRGRGAAELREVQLGVERQGDWVEVVGGLRAGDRLIIDAPAGMSDGRKVRVVGEAPGGVGGES